MECTLQLPELESLRLAEVLCITAWYEKKGAQGTCISIWHRLFS